MITLYILLGWWTWFCLSSQVPSMFDRATAFQILKGFVVTALFWPLAPFYVLFIRLWDLGVDKINGGL